MTQGELVGMARAAPNAAYYVGLQYLAPHELPEGERFADYANDPFFMAVQAHAAVTVGYQEPSYYYDLLSLESAAWKAKLAESCVRFLSDDKLVSTFLSESSSTNLQWLEKVLAAPTTSTSERLDPTEMGYVVWRRHLVEHLGEEWTDRRARDLAELR